MLIPGIDGKGIGFGRILDILLLQVIECFFYKSVQFLVCGVLTVGILTDRHPGNRVFKPGYGVPAKGDIGNKLIACCEVFRPHDFGL